MSDTGKEEREWRFYLDDMTDFAMKVQRRIRISQA